MKTRLLVLLLLVASAAQAQVDPGLFSGMKWRPVGPFRGGRSIACAGSQQRPKEYFFGATGGGVWKTTDAGLSWAPVSDGFFQTASVGALAIAPSNPDIVIAGTGERDVRGNISHGDGAYRSDDAGKTWRHIGLREAQTISRIVIHPTDPNTIWVAALGHFYAHPGVGTPRNGGVYKTTDGGKTWTNVLPSNSKSGAVHITIDPQNPDVLLAALWESWRSPYMLNSGGEGSGMHKSVDGGRTWINISRAKGLPTGLLGKIGFAISPVDPKRYWAMVEALDGGLFRSDDAGATWEKVNDNRNYRQRAWYYTHVYADTKNKDTIYVLNVGAGKSTDGGRTFSGMRTPHSDNHDLWIAPDDPQRMINANDGGANVSTDGGRNWTEQTYPTGQFYHVSTDNAFPYRILGAQQDNSTVRIPSRTRGGGITATDWTSTAGGESGYVSAKPDDPDIVFGGNYGSLEMLNHRTNESREVIPWPDNPMGHGAIDSLHRIQWTFPIVFSPHDPNLLYTCSQYVLKTTNGGQTWQRISPDLTRNDPSTLGPSGGPITKDNTSVEYYATVFTLAESPKKRGVLWAGSDDGLIHITEDGGKNWRNITPTGMPKWGLVSMIEASPHDPATAYAAVDNHENDDLAPYAYKTTDYGRTWTRIVNGLPKDSFVRVVREDKRQKGLLYAGTETGMWVSFDAGANWQSLSLNVPVTPVHDIAWKDDDLVIATHGRGFWVLDDVTPLQQLSLSARPSSPTFFAPRDSYRVRWGGGGGFGGGGGGGRGGAPAAPSAGNPLSGVVLSYYLPENTTGLTFEFADKEGKVFLTLSNPPSSKGFNRTSAFPQYPSYRQAPGMIFWAAGPRPIVAPPGEYTVTMKMGGAIVAHKFRWLKDPRGAASDADLVEQARFLKQISAKVTEANDAVLLIRQMRSDLDKRVADAEKKGDATALKASVDSFKAAIVKVEEAIYQTQNRSGQDPLNYPIRLNNKIAALFGVVAQGDFRPTDQSYEVFDMLSKQLATETATLDKLAKTDLAKINDDLKRLGLEPVASTLARS